MSCRCRFRKNLLDARHSFSEKQAAYFDYNATTPVYPEVLGARDRIERGSWYNASSLHSAGVQVWQIIDDAAQRLGTVFSVDSGGFSFASTASAVFEKIIAMTVFDDVLLCTSAAEHTSIHKQARFRAFAGKSVLVLPVGSDGVIDLQILKKTVAKNRVCILYSPVNHETGSVQPVREIFDLVKTGGGTVILDAVQAAARLPYSEWTGFADMFVFSAHKISGPKGSAALWIHPDSGGFLGNWRRRGFNPGTKNIPGIAGLAMAAEIHSRHLSAELSRLDILLAEGLEILAAKTHFIVNSPQNSAAGVCNISFPWVRDIARLLFELDARNIQLSRFSACSSGLENPSRILLAMGMARHITEKSVRICLGRNSSRKDFFVLAKALLALQKQNI